MRSVHNINLYPSVPFCSLITAFSFRCLLITWNCILKHEYPSVFTASQRTFFTVRSHLLITASGTVRAMERQIQLCWVGYYRPRPPLKAKCRREGKVFSRILFIVREEKTGPPGAINSLSLRGYNPSFSHTPTWPLGGPGCRCFLLIINHEMLAVSAAHGLK